MEPQTHEELVAHTGQAVQREVVNKSNGEVYPVLSTTFGEGVVEFTTDNGVFSFENKGDNTFEDDIVVVREV